MVGSERVQVCAKIFLSTYSVSEKRIRRLRHLKVYGKQIDVRRGMHTSNVLSADVLSKIRDHISSFPKKITDYSGKGIQFLNADLNVKTM